MSSGLTNGQAVPASERTSSAKSLILKEFAITADSFFCGLPKPSKTEKANLQNRNYIC